MNSTNRKTQSITPNLNQSLETVGIYTTRGGGSHLCIEQKKKPLSTDRLSPSIFSYVTVHRFTIRRCNVLFASSACLFLKWGQISLEFEFHDTISIGPAIHVFIYSEIVMLLL
jgi:hypothetical protein